MNAEQSPPDESESESLLSQSPDTLPHNVGLDREERSRISRTHDEKMEEFESRIREARAADGQKNRQIEAKIKELKNSLTRCQARVDQMKRESVSHERRRAEWTACFRSLIASGDKQKWQAANVLKDTLGPEFTQGAVYQRHVAEYEQGLYLTERAISLAEEDLRAEGTSDIAADILEELCGYARNSLHMLQALAGRIQAVGLLTSSDSHNLRDYAESMDRLEARCNELVQQLDGTTSRSALKQS